MTDTDRSLKTAILDWRQQQAVKKFGCLFVRRLGAKFLISDEIVDHLVACAHARKPLSNVEQLYQQTKWRREWIEELGTSLLKVIHTFFPQAVASTSAASTPAAATTSTAPSDAPPEDPAPDKIGVKRKKRCGNCGMEGHIRTNSNCPINIAERARALGSAPVHPVPLAETAPITAAPPHPRPRPVSLSTQPSVPKATTPLAQPCPRPRPIPFSAPPPRDVPTLALPTAPVFAPTPAPLPHIYQQMLAQPFAYPVLPPVAFRLPPQAGPSNPSSPHYLPPSS
ncbi:hypothetical protein LshimejAT787_0604640 [Lyophyllum shimeji]|uniref:Zinc knuckle domain-containing protein n=1 Tax=Lyophyllum shimeji TaxID=47721 RepID=A0A9P3PQ17_LYOSH|nr:hypothetical protein LshimejAT787_0604640 [Lyophyllum shimeji]